MRKKLFPLFLILLISCNSLDKKFAGNWVIDKAYVYDEPRLWNLYGNGLHLKKDHTCELPIWDWADRHSTKEEGEWKVYKKNDSIYLEIITENEFFNRTFKVNNLRKVRDLESGGYFTKMSLTTDSLKMDCTGDVYDAVSP